MLQFGDHSLWSAAGVQQGDSLGPLLFAAALHPVVAGLSDLTVDGASLDMNAFFLDDGFLAGELPVVAAALQRLLAEAAGRGLEFNLAKCTLVLPADAAQQDLSAFFPADLLCDPTSGESWVSAGGNFDVLKAAIGDQAHCEAFAEDRVTAAAELIRLLPGIGNPHVALRLLRHCGSYCEVVHQVRTTPPDHQLDALQRFDTEVRETFGLMTGLYSSYRFRVGSGSAGYGPCGLGSAADGVTRPSSLHGIAGGVNGPRARSRRRVLHRHAAYGAGVGGLQQPRAGTTTALGGSRLGGETA